MRLPLSDAEKAETVRRLLAGRKLIAEEQRHPTEVGHDRLSANHYAARDMAALARSFIRPVPAVGRYANQVSFDPSTEGPRRRNESDDRDDEEGGRVVAESERDRGHRVHESGWTSPSQAFRISGPASHTRLRARAPDGACQNLKTVHRSAGAPTFAR